MTKSRKEKSTKPAPAKADTTPLQRVKASFELFARLP